MHGDMGGYYEIRVTGPGREQFRLFCMLENADKRTLTARGLGGPAIARDHGNAQENRDGLQRPRLRQGPTTWQRPHCAESPTHRKLGPLTTG